jgi:hypothetical protein
MSIENEKIKKLQQEIKEFLCNLWVVLMHFATENREL